MPLLFIGIPLLAVILINVGPRKWISKMHAFYAVLAAALAQIALAAYVGVTVGAGDVSNMRFLEKLSIDLTSAVVLYHRADSAGGAAGFRRYAQG